ncbi:MAG: family hydrolase [Candidatus Saccharibacteria bacterium]|nr:family hydrolase [Candidatus Saccharibacteria bacterium]
MPKALLFDFDGVIVLSEHPRFKIMQRIARDNGLEIPDDYFKKLVGTTTRNFFATYFSSLDPEVTEQIIRDYSAEFKDNIIDHVTPVRDTTEFIKQYRGNLVLGVVSGNDTKVLHVMLEHLGLKDRFSLILGKEHVTTHKPNPAVYILAAKQLGLEPKDCIAIEDSVSGVSAGTSAGLEVYVFLNGLNDQSEFDHLPIAGFVRSAQDITDIIS